MKYKLVIFDFDGTLADTFPWFLNVINKVADEFNFNRVDPQDESYIRNLSSNGVLKHLGIPLWKIPKISKYMQLLMSNDIEQIKLFDGVDFLLKTLHEKEIMIGVVSSNSKSNIESVLGENNLSYITRIECGVSVFGKPSKINKIIKASNIQVDDAIFIGDEVRDIKAAKKLNLDSGAVAWGYNHVEALKKASPTKIYESVNDIFEK